MGPKSWMNCGDLTSLSITGMMGIRGGESSPNGRMITAIFRLVKYSCASVIQPGKTIHNVYIYILIYT